MSLLIDLHWLPISPRVEYKDLTLVYRCMHDLALYQLFFLDLSNCHNFKVFDCSFANHQHFSTQAKSKALGDRSFAVKAQD